ncbi:ATP synthase gamma chain, chloroplastic [Vigna radiata var. radiata]|uniref:ATP synthase gamma chain, chloroplastic n=1 Tax=Vigna radiata var. radiata TaxID=3916 RepID=A0A1S3W0J9_VIGRR|nr:ATP synthase gamma chain, chloroplastic [Vigna radiata var. radiata]
MQFSYFMFSLSKSNFSPVRPTLPPVRCGIRELRQRIHTVQTTQKITEAMKLVAAARVRRAQEAVVNGRPFASNLAEMLNDITQRLKSDDVSTPLTDVRPVKTVALVVFTGDRGLCGGFNKWVIKKAVTRIEELKKLNLECVVISVGKKGNSFFTHNYERKHPFVKVDSFIEIGGFPTAKEAQVIADDIFSLFVSEEVDRVELVYTRFVSLVRFEPVVQTLLPLGEVYDVKDDVFRLSSKAGKLAVERDVVRLRKEGEVFSPLMEFEQDPVLILDAMLPLYLNSQILRALQESVASELAARMGAMASATDNAVELGKRLSVEYNRERQAKITGELLEIVAGAEALTPIDL